MKKFDWNAPMSRKNWAWVYGICAGFVILFYAVLWIVYEIRMTRLFSKKAAESTEREMNEDLGNE